MIYTIETSVGEVQSVWRELAAHGADPVGDAEQLQVDGDAMLGDALDALMAALTKEFAAKPAV